MTDRYKVSFIVVIGKEQLISSLALLGIKVLVKLNRKCK